ncbi:ribosome maturation factor RimP [Rhizosphaericola mali]|uniref:Ribosome maturation factor RimP n=1 Tax=Rhizosphaericola mali TaxID=2545455 RepID=A0A5P2G1S1_9BACT|nr:ribosome maturation factor [Rhizosphaericola mali]QES89756.1 ribosome maturation factor [Rhizosphaericola mali]
MANEIVIEELKKILAEILAEETEYFLVGIKIKPTNNIKIYIDGDYGITIEKCIKINRKMYPILEEQKLFPADDFSLEVSSPGIDTPLVLQRQFVKNKGRLLEVVLLDETEKLGKLIEVTDADITLEITTGKGKKAVTTQEVIPFENIKKATIQIQF